MESMLRALQPDIMGGIGLLVFALIVYFSGRFIVGRTFSSEQQESAREAMKWVRLGVVIIIALTVLVGVLRVLTYSAVNRMPRSDVDGSTVYDKMNENAEPTQPKN